MDLWNMYQRFAGLQGWRFEVMDLSLNEGGGCKHGSAAISGKRLLETQLLHGINFVSIRAAAASTAAPPSQACWPESLQHFDLMS